MPARAPEPEARAALFTAALRDVPKLLTLQDRNPLSVTYGCFDRNYWHYKIIDFPSGMAQEFVLPLALAWAMAMPGNSFAARDVVREWVRAGIDFAARASRSDGSCDDYYPFERATGAAAFSLYAALRAIEIAGLDYRPFESFLLRRGAWLYAHMESGRLSNHEGLVATCLFRLARLTGHTEFDRMGDERLGRLLAWQSTEGWFPEYQGCDPGYLTLTIAMLAEMDAMNPDRSLKDAIARAVNFLARIQPPDGWFGGEWTSRNTHNYFPHGLELCGRWLPEALVVNSRAVAHLINARPEYADDHIIGHHCWSYLLAARDWVGDRPPEPSPPPSQGREIFPEAGIVIDRHSSRTLLCATKKGGAFRLYDGKRLAYADTGLSLRARFGKRERIAVCHLWAEDNDIIFTETALSVRGCMAWASTGVMTPVKNVILRLLMLTVGRFAPDFIRRLLQRLLITGRERAPFRFARRFTWAGKRLLVEDELEGNDWRAVTAGGIGVAQTSIYAVMSRVFHPSQLFPCIDLTDTVRNVHEGRFRLRRSL